MNCGGTVWRNGKRKGNTTIGLPETRQFLMVDAAEQRAD
jgi:hypothetical protein